MSPARKMKMFDLLVRMGYKEIEVGFPVGQRDRLRLRAPADRGRPHPRRRHDLGAHPGPRGPDRAQRAVAGRRAPRQHPPLQRAGAAVPPGGLPGQQGRDQGHRGPRHRAGDEARREPPRHDRHRLRVQPGDLHLHRAAVLGRGLRGGLRRLAARRRPRDHPQPAGDGRGRDAERLRRPDRVVLAPADPPREHRDLPAPAQRPGYGGGRDRAGRDGRGRPRRGLPVRPRRAHRQRRPGHARHEPVQPGRRPDDRLRSTTSTRSVAPSSTAPSCRSTRGTRTPATWSTRRSPGRTRTRSRRAWRTSSGRPPSRASRSSSCPGRRRTCRSTRRTSAAPTRRSSGSTASPARAASPTSSRPSTSWTCRAARRSSSAGSCRSAPTPRAAR